MINGCESGKEKVEDGAGHSSVSTKSGLVQTTVSFIWDALGNLLGVKLPSGTAITYLYDGRNRRVDKEVNGTLTEGLLYDGQLAPVAMLNGSGNIVEQFVYGTRPKRHLLLVLESGKP